MREVYRRDFKNVILLAEKENDSVSAQKIVVERNHREV